MKTKGTVLVTAGIVMFGAVLLIDRYLIRLPNPVMIGVCAVIILLLLSGMFLLRKT